jgi:hypothetical protein
MDYRKPTNPEAGPSDTVPAMLTPGEAVIPAPAAQNPANKPAIEAMINEGRVKNNIFDAAESIEANEIPPIQNLQNQIVEKEGEMVTRESEEFPELPYKALIPGLTDNYVTPLQFLAFKAMENFSLQPKFEEKKEKDLLDLEKQKFILKGQLEDQKGEFKLQQEGFKSLMDNQKIIQKQNALNKTLGVPKVQGSPPKPQGFQQGSGDVSYYNPEGFTKEELYADRPGLGFFQAAAGGPAVMTDISDAELSEIANFGRTTMQQQAAQGELERRMGQVPMGSETVPIEASAPIRVAGSDNTIVPPKPVETKILTNNKPKTVITPGNGKTPPAGSKTSSKFFEDLKGGFGSAFKKVFDPESIATAGIYYGVNRLLGYDNDVAARQAAMGYVAGQKERQERVAEERLLQRQQAKDEASLNKAKLATLEKRRESAISNQIKLDEYGQTTLRTALSDTGLEVSDSPILVSYVSSELGAVVDQFGLDLSDPADFRAAQQLIPSVMQKFVTGLKGDASNMAPGAMSTAVDRVMLQRRELGNAFEGVTPKSAANVFGKIKNNIARERSTSDAGFVNASFEDRVSHAYNVFNQFTPEQLNSLGLRAPSEGENTFTVFLEKMLANKKSLMNVK